MNIYVGNLAYSVDEEALKNIFGEFGTVVSAKVIKDKFTGSSKGFAFVEMSTSDEADQAIEALDGKNVDGRTLRVAKARPQENRPHGGGDRNRGPRRF